MQNLTVKTFVKVNSTSDSESTACNLPRKLKSIRNYMLTKKTFEFYQACRG